MKFDKEAICVFQDSNIKGNIIFREYKLKKHTEIIIDISNVPEGLHGFHIHQSGDLREGCSSLCAHYNPTNKQHGGRENKERHIGDLGNITAKKNGIIKSVFTDKKIKLSGKYSIVGRSVVIHDGEDDLGKGSNKESLKTGNAGKRIACGVIGLSKNSCY